MKELLIWGIGNRAYKWLYENQFLLENFEIKAFIDSYVKSDDNLFQGKKVISPDKIQEFSYDLILVLSSFCDDIKRIATEKYGIESHILLTEKEFILRSFFELDLEKQKNLLYGEGREIEQRNLLMTFTQSDVLRQKIDDQLSFEFIKNRYQSRVPAIEELDYCKEESEIANCKAWVFWFQGEESAPDLVKACIQSVRKNMKSFEIVVLDKDNYKKYASIPDDILTFLEEGKMSLTQFSDILRLELLKRHGGLWIDATVYCSDDVPSSWLTGDFFAFSYPKKSLPADSLDLRPITSWFLYAKPNNPIVVATLQLMYCLWRENKRLIHYCQIHYLFNIVLSVYVDEANKIPYITRKYVNVLRDHLSLPFEQGQWEQIIKLIPVHKMSYKMEINQSEGTFYKHILEIL